MSSLTFFPPSPRDALIKHFVGQSIRDVPTPSAIIDVAAVRRNCERMLDACKNLELGWRAHVKTHKTVEITQYQVGSDPSRPVNLIVSTLSELEFLLETLKEYHAQGRAVNVVYGLPVAPGAIPRLAAVAKELGPDSISVLVDHPDQLQALPGFVTATSGIKLRVYMKIDMGGRRAGVVIPSQQFSALARAALRGHASGDFILAGLYSHAGHSYGGDSRAAAIKMLNAELSAMLFGADFIAGEAAKLKLDNPPSLVLSAGASPTALSVQNLLSADVVGAPGVAQDRAVTEEAIDLKNLFGLIKDSGHVVEIHAGVYPLLDLQQLAAHSIATSRLSWSDMALTILAEVHSYYPKRGADGSTDEALVGAGGLALGREFCKDYDGMAILSPWNRPGSNMPETDVKNYTGWTIGRFAQEHGIATWASGKGVKDGEERPGKEGQDELKVGQKVMLWPNHACITSSHFGWYLVVDGDGEDREKVVDVWVKARGW